jgi:threonine dehydratase
VKLSGKKIAAVLSGGNVDVNFISRIIERGLVESGRFAHFTITLKDKPGELQRVLSSVTELNANVQFVNLHRIGKHIYPGNALLEISVETKDHAHIEQLYKNLRSQGFQLQLEE